MENMPQNIRPKDLSFVVQAIGADIERTQVQLITSANADMLLVQQLVALIQHSEKQKDTFTQQAVTQMVASVLPTIEEVLSKNKKQVN
ncbi:hypothetical protein [Capnocytophaga granulosa]